MARDLLLEIGTEELPISIFPEILNTLKEIIGGQLDRVGLKYRDIKVMATPRRLTIFVYDMVERQPDKVELILGPPYNLAFDEEGNPTKAAIGFAKKQAVDLKDLKAVDTKKGRYVAIEHIKEGKKAEEVLRELLPQYILSLPFKKTMRWGHSRIRFVRPIHWVLALLGKDIIPFEIDGISSGRDTYGHRFLEKGPMPIENTDEYISRLKEAHVVVDHEERKKLIKREAEREVAKIGAYILEDEALLDQINFLVEFPVAILGKFEKKFLGLPQTVLITVMKHHQKYLAVVDKEGELLPYFVAVINMPVRDIGPVRTGLERVLKARLEDARFFYEQDLKVPLKERVEALRHVIFQEKLGTVWEKVQRVRRLARALGERICPDKIESLERAATLCKADLTTEMVNEFPELQGIMGEIYARESGEEPEVAKAISEHYLPISAGGTLPKTQIGSLLAIADKIDSIVGCFGIGLIPTGEGDPFALRRQAIGVLRILKKISFPLGEIIEMGLNIHGFSLEIKEKIDYFFRQRLQYLLLDEGHPFEVVDAVLSVFDGDVLACFRRVEALKRFKETEDFSPLVMAYKRVHRIIETPIYDLPEPELFEAEEEKRLYETYQKIEEEVEDLIKKGRFYEALGALSMLKVPIDKFFDHVMVMVEDHALRKNRLALLTQIKRLFLKVADLSKIPM